MIHLPVDTITGVSFGCPDLDCMLVTTALQVQDFNQPPPSYQPVAPNPWRGQVFLITKLNVKGAMPGTRVELYITQ